jgi:hypothetical protein
MFFSLILEQKENKARGKKSSKALLRAFFRSLDCAIPSASRGWAFRLPFAQSQP